MDSIIISPELNDEINYLLNNLGLTPITNIEVNLLQDLCYPSFSTMTLRCQAILIVCYLFKYRGLTCVSTKISYLEELSNCNNCNIDVKYITNTNNKIYSIGVRSGVFPFYFGIEE